MICEASLVADGLRGNGGVRPGSHLILNYRLSKNNVVRCRNFGTERYHLRDNDGNRYLDFVRGWAVNCLGHSPGVIAEAQAEKSRKLITIAILVAVVEKMPA
jgi:acetylornithine/succinyldiaminopimelate/putrescine aminotransferase